MLKINDRISIEDWEITEQFIRASGPGGQNVNKVSSAVELRFEADRSPNLPASVKTRLRKIAGTRSLRGSVSTGQSRSIQCAQSRAMRSARC